MAQKNLKRSFPRSVNTSSSEGSRRDVEVARVPVLVRTRLVQSAERFVALPLQTGA